MRPFSALRTSVPLLGAVFLLIVGTACQSSEPGIDPAELEGLEGQVSALQSEIESLENELAALRRENSQLRSRLSDQEQRRGETVEVLSTDLFFESGSAQLTPEGVERLVDVAQKLRGQFSDRVVRVEGYTDNKPIGDRLSRIFASNWELSAARASAVVRHLQWTHELSPNRFEVVGFGQYQPIATNETAEGRSENRRVRVAVLPANQPITAGE
ncbi:MAG: flagellar motor protein MotB [Longimonas sp.]|uniref:flagellar motor protein MotB n=1 Tax=Longimonas sp. TaxID=2039626 RepID=UPI003353B0A4